MSTPIFEDDGVVPSSGDTSGRPPKGQKKTPAWVVIGLVLGGISLLVCPTIAMLTALLLPAVSNARAAARQAQARNNMKQIGLAIHNFADNHQQLPPSTIVGDEDNEGELHSWMTDLLPYLDSSPLYGQVDRQQVWTADANKAPFSTVIPVFRDPSDPGKPLNKAGYAVADFAANSQVMSDQRRLRFRDFEDGLSNTIMAGNVAAGHKAWADPTNSRDPAKGLNGGSDEFGSYHPIGVLIMMADGAVRPFSKNTDPDLLRRLASPAGGEPVDDLEN